MICKDELISKIKIVIKIRFKTDIVKYYIKLSYSYGLSDSPRF